MAGLGKSGREPGEVEVFVIATVCGDREGNPSAGLDYYQQKREDDYAPERA